MQHPRSVSRSCCMMTGIALTLLGGVRVAPGCAVAHALGATDELASVSDQPSHQRSNPHDEELVRVLDQGCWGRAHIEAARRLLRHGASIRTQGKHGATVLMLAARNGDFALMKAALDGGVDVNARSQGGWTALMHVMRSRNKDMVRTLLRAGADVNAQDAWGRTPLMFAAHFKFRGGINLLLSHGADINARNKRGHTVLAYTDEHPGLTRLLKEHGAKE